MMGSEQLSNKVITRTRGFMLILSSPSGGGKTTISRKLLENDKNLRVSTSVTTRAARVGEVDGCDYFFVDYDKFKQLRSDGYFLEYAKVFDHYYGTPRDLVEKYLRDGNDVLFDIDWQGTIQLTQSARNDVVSIFILPPSLSALKNRLCGRGTDDAEIINARMHRAKSEINHWYGYDYVIINDRIDQCLEDCLHIIKAERMHRMRQDNMRAFVEKMFADFKS